MKSGSHARPSLTKLPNYRSGFQRRANLATTVRSCSEAHSQTKSSGVLANSLWRAASSSGQPAFLKYSANVQRGQSHRGTVIAWREQFLQGQHRRQPGRTRLSSRLGHEVPGGRWSGGELADRVAGSPGNSRPKASKLAKVSLFPPGISVTSAPPFIIRSTSRVSKTASRTSRS